MYTVLTRVNNTVLHSQSCCEGRSLKFSFIRGNKKQPSAWGELRELMWSSVNYGPFV